MELIKINSKDIPTKEELKQASARMAEQVIFGEISPIEAHLKLSLVKDMAEDVLKQIRGSVSDDLDRYGKDKPTVAGWTIEKFNGGNVAKFDHNPEWVRLKEQLADLEDKMKAASKGMTIIDENTGEVIPPAVFVPKEDSIRKSFKR
jgi:hypothetical protein